MSIFLLFTDREISESLLLPRSPSRTPVSLCQQPSSRRGVYGSNVIESTGQETRAFILQARHTLVTSQPEATLSLSPPLPLSLSPSLSVLSVSHFCRGPLLPPLPADPTTATAAAAIVSKYHAPINHREHRILYLRTIREGWRQRRLSMGGWGGTGPTRSKLTRRRLFYFPPQSRRVRPTDGNQARGSVARFIRPNDNS